MHRIRVLFEPPAKTFENRSCTDKILYLSCSLIILSAQYAQLNLTTFFCLVSQFISYRHNCYTALNHVISEQSVFKRLNQIPDTKQYLLSD